MINTWELANNAFSLLNQLLEDEEQWERPFLRFMTFLDSDKYIEEQIESELRKLSIDKNEHICNNQVQANKSSQLPSEQVPVDISTATLMKQEMQKYKFPTMQQYISPIECKKARMVKWAVLQSLKYFILYRTELILSYNSHEAKQSVFFQYLLLKTCCEKQMNQLFNFPLEKRRQIIFDVFGFDQHPQNKYKKSILEMNVLKQPFNIEQSKQVFYRQLQNGRVLSHQQKRLLQLLQKNDR